MGMYSGALVRSACVKAEGLTLEPVDDSLTLVEGERIRRRNRCAPGEDRPTARPARLEVVEAQLDFYFVLTLAPSAPRSRGAHNARGSIGAIVVRTVRKAMAYVASTDRAWPFSFENLCEALGLDAGCLREELDLMRASA